jgi:hypothetical protein
VTFVESFMTSSSGDRFLRRAVRARGESIVAGRPGLGQGP